MNQLLGRSYGRRSRCESREREGTKVLELNVWRLETRVEGNRCRHVGKVSVTLSEIENYKLINVLSTTVTAKLNSTDAKQTTFGVSELKTPLGTYPNAVLRQEDIVHMEIKLTPSDLQYLLNV